MGNATWPLQREAPSAFGELLKRYRATAGLTQEALAEQARLSTRAVSDLERGVNLTPRLTTVQLLVQALGLAGPDRALFEAAARRRAASGDASPPAAVALTAPPQTLPVALTPLIGREREEAAVAHLLQRAAVRLLTLTGPGGVGKTRLALRMAESLGAGYADGVIFVALAPLTDPGLVAATIAQTLGLREAGEQTPQERLVAFLREKQSLLLLDNFEQVVAAAPVINDLLVACPQLKVLVTSRAALHVQGEQEYAVPPLALPHAQQPPDVDGLAQYAAVALFVQRARAVKPDFALTAANAAAVAQICQRLDGLPLALELAAARSKLLPPQPLQQRLDRRLPLLTGGARDLPARLQTMRNAVAWSYDLLTADQQILFGRLCVFVGGCTLEAAEAVCGMVGERSVDVLAGLDALVDESLLRLEEGPRGEARFELLETIREYGLERLEASGEGEVLRQQHTAYYLALAEEAEPELTGTNQAAWLARLEQEADNFRAALQWAIDRAPMDQSAEMGLRLAGALWRLWQAHGYLSEGRGWLERLLARPASGSHAPLAAVRAKALHAAAALAYR